VLGVPVVRAQAVRVPAQAVRVPVLVLVPAVRVLVASASRRRRPVQS
jgi:hypothetical protein